MLSNTKTIKFDGGELLGVRTEEGEIYLGVRKACMDIGMSEGQAKRQIRNIREDIVLNKGGADLPLLTKGGEQETFCLSERFVTLWLAKISLTPAMKRDNPQAVEKLFSYQLKAADALHEAFMATEEQKQEFYNTLGIEGKIVELETKIDDMRTSFDSLMQYVTINSREAQKILKAAKDRINSLLGGAHSEQYKKEARIYFKNMWNEFAEKFGVASYKDISPSQVEDGYVFIKNWIYS